MARKEWLRKEEFYVLTFDAGFVARNADLSSPSIWTTKSPALAKKFGPDIPKGWKARYPEAKLIKIKASYKYGE
jgi:hypothetical protein